MIIHEALLSFNLKFMFLLVYMLRIDMSLVRILSYLFEKEVIVPEVYLKCVKIIVVFDWLDTWTANYHFKLDLIFECLQMT